MEENEGYTQPLDSFVEGERNVDVLRPYGVFGVIAPFNFPVALSVGMAGSALIAGNTVVFKPSEETPSTGRGARGDRAGRRAAGRRLQPRARRPRHGARARGRRRRRRSPSPARRRSAGRSRASSRTAPTRARRSPRWAGRTRRSSRPAPTSTPRRRASRARRSACRARSAAPARARSSRTRCYDEFVEKLAARAGELALGDPSERERVRGPVINEGSVERYRRAVAAAERDGRVAAGGGRPGLPGPLRRADGRGRTCRTATSSSATSCSCPS